MNNNGIVPFCTGFQLESQINKYINICTDNLQPELVVLTLQALNLIVEIFTHLKLCLATATHDLDCVKITHIFLIWDSTFAC